MVLGAGWYVVNSVGNPATDAPGTDGNDGQGYDSVSGRQTAKNTLVVGAIEDISVESSDSRYSPRLKSNLTTGFSSWGNLDDGSLGIDVVANGLELTSSSARGDNAQTAKSGTSMSAPSVTGLSSLLLQHYRNRSPGSTLPSTNPTSATQKAVLMHTAKDVFIKGPDYATGYGLVQGDAAVQFIDNAAGSVPPSLELIG